MNKDVFMSNKAVFRIASNSPRFDATYGLLIALVAPLGIVPWVQWSRGFSYVGACQVIMGFYMFALRWMSRIARFAQSLHYSERSSQFDGPFVLVMTSKTPRRAHSAIRAQEDMPPAHEISCASDDAHSALTGSGR